MSMGKILRARQLIFGKLPINLLDRSTLSPYARLLWGVLDSCGDQSIHPSVEFLAIRMGLEPSNRVAVYRALDELVSGGFLEVMSSNGARGTNEYFLKLPDYCLVDSPQVLEAAFLAPVAANANGWRGARGRTAKVRRGGKPAFDRVAWLLGRVASKIERGRQLALSVFTETAAQQQVEAATDSAQAAAAAAAPTGPVVAPAGWEGYAAAYQARTRRPFVWSKTRAVQADRITRQLGADLVPGTWAAFLQEAYWQQKGYPWAALVKAWPDLVPARAAVPSCRHQDQDSAQERGQHHGRAGAWLVHTCKACTKEVGRVFYPDPTPEEAAQQAAFLEKLRAKGMDVAAWAPAEGAQQGQGAR